MKDQSSLLFFPLGGLDPCVERSGPRELALRWNYDGELSEAGMIAPQEQPRNLRDRVSGLSAVPGYTPEDFVAAWWLEQFENAEVRMGDQIAILGPGAVAEVACLVARTTGAGRILAVVVNESSCSGGTTEVDHLSIDADDLHIASKVEHWFSEGAGRAVLAVVDASASVLTQCFKVLPRWGTLLVGESRPRNVRLILDVYSDIHRRGCEIRGLIPWIVNPEDPVGITETKRKLLDRAAQLRRWGRLQLKLPEFTVEDQGKENFWRNLPPIAVVHCALERNRRYD